MGGFPNQDIAYNALYYSWTTNLGILFVTALSAEGGRTAPDEIFVMMILKVLESPVNCPYCVDPISKVNTGQGNGLQR